MILGGCQVKYKKISFDWDNTIAMSYMIDSKSNSELPIYNFQEYNNYIIKLIKDYYSQGIELHIVTSRKTSLEEYYPEDSVLYQLKILKLDHIFPSERVHFTEGKLKAELLKKIGIELHYDDSIEEILNCKRKGINVKSSLKGYEDTDVVAKGIITDIHGSILLLKRTDEGTKWDIPGGHIKNIEVERGLKGLSDGYEREVGEETGLIIPKSRLIHKYTHTWKGEDMDMNILLSDFAIEEPYVDLNIQDFQENSEYIWVQEEELDFYMQNMTEVALIAIQFYLDNIDNPEVILKDFLPSQSQSWAKMKKQLDEAVRERKKELKSKLSEITKKTRKSSAMDRTFKNIMDSLTSIYESTNPLLTQEDKNLQQAELLSKFIKDSQDNLLPQVRIKGSGYGYYYSLSDKKTIMVPRNSEYYLISNKKDSLGRLKVYSHYKFMSGAVFLIPEDEIELIGWN